MPDIGQMARRAARRKEDDVDSHIIARFRQIMPQYFRRRRDPRQPAFVDRQVQFRRTPPSLHLDEGDHAAPSRDQIHLARRGPHAAAHNLPAPQAQPPGGDAFGLSPALLRLLFAHSSASAAFNSVARS